MTVRAEGATASAAVGRGRAVGWEARGRGAQARRGEEKPATSAARAPQGEVARARHVARARRDPVAALRAHLSVRRAGARGLAQGFVPSRTFFGADRPHPSGRRGRRAGGARARPAGAGRPLREGDQPRCLPAWERLGEPLSRTRAAHAHRSAPWSRLRAPQLPEALARRARRRPAELGSVVRRVAASSSPVIRPSPCLRRPAVAARVMRGRPRADVARARRMATRGRVDRLRRTPVRVSAWPRPAPRRRRS